MRSGAGTVGALSLRKVLLLKLRLMLAAEWVLLPRGVILHLLSNLIY